MNEKLDRFHRYMNRYEKMIKRYAGKFVGSHLAEDVTQEVLFKMYQKINCLNDDTIVGWLLVVTKNISIDYLKKGGRMDTYPIDPYEIMNYVDSAEETIFEKRERQREAAVLCGAAFDLLYQKNPQWYEVIVDSDVLGMSSKQIASELGISPGYVNIIKFRAKKYLNKKLGSEYKECL